MGGSCTTNNKQKVNKSIICLNASLDASPIKFHNNEIIKNFKIINLQDLIFVKKYFSNNYQILDLLGKGKLFY